MLITICICSNLQQNVYVINSACMCNEFLALQKFKRQKSTKPKKKNYESNSSNTSFSMISFRNSQASQTEHTMVMPRAKIATAKHSTMEKVRATSEFVVKNILKLKPKCLLFVAILIAFIASHSIYLDSAMWTLSAIGRIAMIKILPYWDWTRFYNVKCLIAKSNAEKEQQVRVPESFKDCHLCEKLDYIRIMDNITFLQLRDKFIYKAKPVLIRNSSDLRRVTQLLPQLFDSLDFLESRPCDVETNLMQQRFFSLAEALSYIMEGIDASWFLQLRNCQSFAVKASRQFLHKPYFYAEHMEPYYSSWLLMANNYAGLQNQIKLYGLIIVQQLQGDLIVSLKPQSDCLDKCKIQNVVIKEGESLVFSTDLWSMGYLVDVNEMILTSIMEVYF